MVDSMDLLEAAAASGGFFALIKLFLFPQIRRRFDRGSANRLTPRLTAMLFFEIAQGACLVVTLSLVAVVALVWAVPLVAGAGSEEALAKAFGGLRNIREWVESLETWWGIAVIAVLSSALWLSLRSEAAHEARRAL